MKIKPIKNLLVTTAAVILISAGFGSLSCSRDDSGIVASIVVAYCPFESTALFWVAQDKQYFNRNGLTVTMRKYDTGSSSLTGLLNNEADIVIGLSEYPVVRMAFQEEKISIIGNADKGDFIYMVGRKDRGIEKPSDLKGKTIGTAFGTIAQFYLGRFLELNGIKTQDVLLVDLKTQVEWVNAVVQGDVDVVVTAQPDANIVKGRLGANGFFWPAQSGQYLNGLIVTSRDCITNHPELAIRFLKSLAQAEEYTIIHPAAAKAIVQKDLGLDAAYMETVWAQNQFALTLEQSIIAAMEDEARWMIANNLTNQSQVLDFTKYMYIDGLKSVKPETINIR